jgi:hypothetical protein
MGDDECRKEDARVEAAIDRALELGTMGQCELCGDITSHKEPETVLYYPRWICKYCQRMMAEPGD